MLAHAGQWVESQHLLRPDMDPRDIDHMELDESTVCLPPPITEVTEEEPIDTTAQSMTPKGMCAYRSHRTQLLVSQAC